jgi:hypothetical protein
MARIVVAGRGMPRARAEDPAMEEGRIRRMAKIQPVTRALAMQIVPRTARARAKMVA